MKQLYLSKDNSVARRIAKRGDVRGVLLAVNEYETMQLFGGYLGLYGVDAPPPDTTYVQRMRLVRLGIAEAERKQLEDAERNQGGGSGSGSTPGSSERTISTAHVEHPARARRGLLSGGDD